MLKILQVVPYFYPAWAYGGIPRVVYELSRELVRMGNLVSVYTTDVLDERSRCGDRGREVVIDGIRVQYFRNVSNRLAYDAQLFLPLGFSRNMRETIGNFDVIHLHGHRNLLNSSVRHIALSAGKPYVLSGHGTVVNIERRILAKAVFDRISGNRVLADASAFVAVSEHEIQQYRSMGIPREKISVIYNGIDPEEFIADLGAIGPRRRYGLEDKRIVLYLGKITPRKGVDILVRAFAALRDPDVVLIIAGNDMGFRREVEAIVREKEVNGRVFFTGLLTGGEKSAAYRDADVLVYPASHEIFGLVPFESIMCGTPVIVTDDCGCGEIIRREQIGLAVRYGDVEDLRAAIVQTLDDRTGAAERTRKGREFVLKSLNWQTIARQHAILYDMVMQ